MKKNLVVAALLAAGGGANAAESADLAAIRAQIAEMKQNYEQRIAALEKKLAAAEAKASAPAPEPVSQAPVAAAAPASASGFNPEVSLILQGQYRAMRDVGGRAISGFWPTGSEAPSRGFSVDESELVLAANIDPYWRGQAIIAASGEQASVEEAWFQSLGLGEGLGLKVGRFKSGIGYLNEQHPHMWDFADAPLMYQAMFGAGGSYAQDGVQLKWLAPTPLFVEFGAEAGRGHNFPGNERNRNGAGAMALFVHAGDDVGVSNSWRAGLSWLSTRAKEREAEFTDVAGATALGRFTGDSDTLIADFVWKWAPDGNPKYRNFKFQTEYFSRRETGGWDCLDGACGTGTDLAGYRSRQSGWYAQGVYQFTPNWRAGLRYEELDSGSLRYDAALASTVLAADNAALIGYRPKKASAMVDYSWSEFSRVRLQVAQDKSMQGVTDNQFSLQYIMSLGAHGAHKF